MRLAAPAALVLLGIAVMATPATQPPAAAVSAEDVRLANYFRSYLDQQFQLFLPLPGRNDDLLGDDHRRRQGERDVLVSAAEPLVGALEGVRHDQQLHQVVVRRRAGGLNDEHVASANVLLNFDGHLAV